MSSVISRKIKPLSKKHASRAAELLQKAWVCLQAGQIQEAESACLSLLNKYPNYPNAILLLGVIAQQVGQIELAITRFQQTIAIKPTFADAYYNLGNALQTLGKIEEAETFLRQALVHNPNFAMAYNNLGIIFTQTEKMEEAVNYFKKAISIKPNYALAHNNLGNTLKHLGRNTEALTHLGKALQLDANYVDAQNNIGALLQSTGQTDEAVKHYERAIELRPDFAAAYYNLTKLKPKQELIPVIERLLSTPSLTEEDEINYHYAMGNIFNHTKNYTGEIEHYLKGNELKRKTLSYDSEKHSAFVDSLINTYTSDFFKDNNERGSNSELPVFIVGMPRSGTTLVEQIISSHPQVFGADELDKIRHLETAVANQFLSVKPYPECISLVDEPTLQQSASEYLDVIRSYSEKATRISDKMPSNFLRIAFIKMLFPKARIIHCRRNALDTCTSIILNNFACGNEYTYDLTEIGKFYLDYERLMKHWHEIFPGEIFDVQYEDLISDQETISHQLIEYLGLKWDEACLGFHNNERAVRTASNLQVRQPIYNKSVERWKRYEEYLQPLINILNNSSEQKNSFK